MQINVNRHTKKYKLLLRELTDIHKSQQIWVVKKPERLLVVITSKNSNALHFAVYTICMPSSLVPRTSHREPGTHCMCMC